MATTSTSPAQNKGTRWCRAANRSEMTVASFWLIEILSTSKKFTCSCVQSASRMAISSM